MDGVFQLLHFGGNVVVDAELVFGIVQPALQAPQILLLLGPRFPGTQGTPRMVAGVKLGAIFCSRYTVRTVARL